MPSLGRREFLQLTGVACAGLLAPRAAYTADARIEVLPDEPIGTVLPDFHGHFVEHLGAVVYDGIWVGESSRIPNIGGLRQSLVEKLKALKPGVIRWPGGCFADSYDWRDGVGPAAERPVRTNFWSDDKDRGAAAGPSRYDPNTFGTNEFVRFCRAVGAEPYVAANVRSLPPRDFYQWVEYANSPSGSTTLAKLRDANGANGPFNVRFWGVGNESWGCGGNFTPEEYATEFRRFIAWVPSYAVKLAFIAAGPGSGDIEWTRGFFEGLVKRDRNLINSVFGWGLHHYSWNVSQGKTNDWDAGKGDALKFTVSEWYELLREANRLDRLIVDHWAAMGEIDRNHHVKIAVDEWGSWHRPGSAVHPSHTLGQQSTLRDALVAGITLDIFNRHADKVVMGNVAQLVNCLHSLFLAHEDQFVTTPNYHVFAMYQAHHHGRAVRTVFDAPSFNYDRAGSPEPFWGLHGSASLHERQLVVTAVNPHATRPITAALSVRGRRITGGEGQVLTSTDLAAHNTFTAPDVLVPKGVTVTASGGVVQHTFPPASVTRLTLSLG